MSKNETETETETETGRVEVTLKKAIKQGEINRQPGEKVMLTPAQKERLQKAGVC